MLWHRAVLRCRLHGLVPGHVLCIIRMRTRVLHASGVLTVVQVVLIILEVIFVPSRGRNGKLDKERILAILCMKC